jgi:hypothetical protein
VYFASHANVHVVPVQVGDECSGKEHEAHVPPQQAPPEQGVPSFSSPVSTHELPLAAQDTFPVWQAVGTQEAPWVHGRHTPSSQYSSELHLQASALASPELMFASFDASPGPASLPLPRVKSPRIDEQPANATARLKPTARARICRMS